MKSSRPVVGPLEVLEHEDDGRLLGDALEERPPRGEQLVAVADRALVEAQQLQEARLDPAPLALVGDALLERRRRCAPASSPRRRSRSSPARLRTISPSAQKLIPSPYAGERPWCQ